MDEANLDNAFYAGQSASNSLKLVSEIRGLNSSVENLSKEMVDLRKDLGLYDTSQSRYNSQIKYLTWVMLILAFIQSIPIVRNLADAFFENYIFITK